MESLDQISNLNLIILVAAGVAIGLIAFRVAQRILKFALIAAVLGLAIFFWRGGTVDELGQESIGLFFKESRIDDMMAVNCPEKKIDRAKCDCVVIPVYKDLKSNFTVEEQDELSEDWELLRREIGKSMKANQEDIRQCLVQNHGKKYVDKLSDFINDFNED